MILRQTSLSANIVQFGRFLRQKNFAIGVEEEALTLQALRSIDFTDLSAFRLVLRTTLCRSKTQTEEFDELFNDYWKQIEKAVDSKSKEGSSKKEPSVPQPAQFK